MRRGSTKNSALKVYREYTNKPKDTLLRGKESNTSPSLT